MNIKTKKIIAREFILLISVISLGLITFLSIYPYNYYLCMQQNNKSEMILKHREIADKIKNMFSSKIEKQKWFFNKFSEYFTSDYPNYEKLWARNEQLLKSDSMKILWVDFDDYTKVSFNKIGFNDLVSFENFIKSNGLNSEESKKKEQYDELKKNIDDLIRESWELKYKKINFSKQIEKSINVILISFILLFILRYIIYGVIWSIKVLKIKTN